MSAGPGPVSLTWAAALCLAALLVRLRHPGGTVRRRALRLVDQARHRGGRPPVARLRESADRIGRAVRGRPEVLCLPVGLVLGVATGSPLPVAVGAGGVPLVGRVLRRRAERAAAERGTVAVGALCGTVAGDLRAGRPPHMALADAVESAGWARVPELAGAAGLLVSAARFGGDVPQALRAASRVHEGTRGLTAVAACWQVAVDGGAGLAAALDRVAAALRAEADQRDDLRAQLAGPRSTAVLLALLPLFGLVLGTGLGADPSAVLLHTPLGLCCLLAGAALEWAGLAWTARIIRAAEDGPGGARGHGRKESVEATGTPAPTGGRVP
ncbi:type II secretion system F family protein [Streptomyces sp. NBC_01476]|uniref:type II secretion system F family protein n=1 Tax=Streptomyces sp. NBC_01476 TaxID=2903881 RepID=UPI002E33C5F9|nr:type II secretion system F family protein [Streptomyces sp. NBC_01476]